MKHWITKKGENILLLSKPTPHPTFCLPTAVDNLVAVLADEGMGGGGWSQL